MFRIHVRAIRLAPLLLGVCVTQVMQPGPSLAAASFLEPPIEGKDQPANKIRALQKERLAVLKEATADIKSAYLAGRTSVDRLQAALKVQHAAELDLCEKDEERLVVLKELLKLAQENEQTVEQRYKAGDLPKSDYLAATASRLEAEIAFERLKAKLQKESK